MSLAIKTKTLREYYRDQQQSADRSRAMLRLISSGKGRMVFKPQEGK